MPEPRVTWERARSEAGQDVDVLVVHFDHNVTLEVHGPNGVPIAHWVTSVPPDSSAEPEVDRALAWARTNRNRIADLFRQRGEP